MRSVVKVLTEPNAQRGQGHVNMTEPVDKVLTEPNAIFV
jgi:hypothetical protein